MQLFVVGPPRSGTTIVTQFLNQHDDITIFDEIDLLEIGRSRRPMVGALRSFLVQHGVYGEFQCMASQCSDPVVALRAVMGEITKPCTIWGEKNPRYATQLEALKRCFPDSIVLFVLRDPRDAVNSCLFHRSSPARTHLDFWIKDTVAEAVGMVEKSVEVLDTGAADVVVRYEAFAAAPKATLELALDRWDLTLSDRDASVGYAPPGTVGDGQFYRGGAVLPWKAANLSPVHPMQHNRDRQDIDDPAWARVDALARRLGYT